MRTVARIALFVLLAAPVSALSQEEAPSRREPLLTVKGEGRHSQAPDFAVFTATVSTQGRTLEEAVGAHAPLATAALARIKEFAPNGMTVRRSDFTSRRDTPVRTPQGEVPVEFPFHATTRYVLELPRFNEANAIVSALLMDGIEIARVEFKVRDVRGALNKARGAAMADARAQADTYAKAGSLRLVGVGSIADGEARPEEVYMDLPYRAAASVQIVPPAAVDFTASVTVNWRIASR